MDDLDDWDPGRHEDYSDNWRTFVVTFGLFLLVLIVAIIIVLLVL